MSEVTWAVAGPPLLEEAAVERAIQAAADLGGRPGLELAVTFVSEAELTRMHGEYLDDPTAGRPAARLRTGDAHDGDAVRFVTAASREDDEKTRAEDRAGITHGHQHNPESAGRCHVRVSTAFPEGQRRPFAGLGPRRSGDSCLS